MGVGCDSAGGKPKFLPRLHHLERILARNKSVTISSPLPRFAGGVYLVTDIHPPFMDSGGILGWGPPARRST